ncbi:hypothetical protein L4X63_13565 [Geomonas sp. Red32]|uniref:hypothetical protein n=1 Tax=Geomonas sp. Red32 TaxID=2912856 RepID=UPI00202CC34A|nr:hypothetical protein [Geomonas sp. Red32]MCM0082623.1 hypothetical protein [Geomonas sp. Red32]
MRKVHPAIVTASFAVSLLLLGYWDYISGFRLSLFPLYLLLLVVVAWYLGKATTLAMSAIAAAIIMVKDSAVVPALHDFYFYWDEGTKCVLLVLTGSAVWQIRHLLTEKETTNRELRKALSEIRELRRMIPICSMCHSIRTDKGFYEKIEVYLSHLTGAELTHGICPACLRKNFSHLTRSTGPEARPAPAKSEKK